MGRVIKVACIAVSLASMAPSGIARTAEEATMVRIQKITPILLAKDVKACVDFWAALGFQAPATVPEGDGLGFAIISGEGFEMMYQSFSSARAQRPEAVERVDRSIVFLEVASLDTVTDALPDTEIVVPDHVTDYGAREIYVRDPAGNLIGFSEPGG